MYNMRKFKRLNGSIYLVLFLITSLTRCAQSSLDESTVVRKSDLDLLAEYGFDLENRIETEEYYLFAPDRIISKEWLEMLRNVPATRMQWNTRYGKLDKKYQTVYLKDPGIEKFADLLRQAVKQWNEIPDSNIRFLFDNNADLKVDITGGYDGDMFDAVIIERPLRTGKYARHVRLNYSKVLPLLEDPLQGKYLMMHILGHLVGFAHAVTDPFVNTPDGFIIGTTNSDTESIMRAENDILTKGKKWTGFSKWDILAVQFVYPYVAPIKRLDISPGGTGEDGQLLNPGTTYTITAKYVDAVCENPVFEYTIIRRSFGKSDYRLENIKNGVINISFLSSGEYEIRVRVTNAPEETVIKRVFYVIDKQMRVQLPLSVELNKPVKIHLACRNPSYPNVNFTLAIRETKFNDPGVVEVVKSSSNGVKEYQLTFKKQGEYEITGNMLNGPGVNRFKFFVHVFYHPKSYRLETIRTPIDAYTSKYQYNLHFSDEEAMPSDYDVIFLASLRWSKAIIKTRGSDEYTEYVKKADQPFFSFPEVCDRQIMGNVLMVPSYDIKFPENKCWKE